MITDNLYKFYPGKKSFFCDDEFFNFLRSSCPILSLKGASQQVAAEVTHAAVNISTHMVMIKQPDEGRRININLATVSLF
jgi:hypothetical protein